MIHKTVLLSALFAVSLSPLKGSMLGIASNYNVFVFGNDTQSGSDIGGRAAIGGNYSGTNTFATAVQDSPGVFDVVVGGNFNLSNNSVNSGDVYVGKNISSSSVRFAGNVMANGSVTLQNSSVAGNLSYGTTYSSNGATVQGTTKQATTSSPIDFSAAQSYLQTLSGMLNNQAATGTASIYYNSITINAKSGYNVIDLNAANLASNYGLTINGNGSADTTVIINVQGAADKAYSFASSGYTLSGITANQVLFNFADALTLSQSGSGINGSILAPYANYSFNNGNVNGQIIANTLSGNGEAHNYLFTGSLPANSSPNAVPEPATFLSMGSVLVGASFFAMRRKRAK